MSLAQCRDECESSLTRRVRWRDLEIPRARTFHVNKTIAAVARSLVRVPVTLSVNTLNMLHEDWKYFVGPGAHPASYTMVTLSFPGLKRPGCDVDHPLPSNAEFKERVELYLHSPFGLSWPILGWTLPLTLNLCIGNICITHWAAAFVEVCLNS